MPNHDFIFQTSREIKISGAIGPCVSLNAKGPCVSENVSLDAGLIKSTSDVTRITGDVSYVTEAPLTYALLTYFRK